MAWMRSLKERLNALFRKGQMDAELDEELRFHIAREIEKNIRAGMDPKKARRTAYVRFGGVERVRDQSRDERGVRPLEDLWSDIRYALRTLRKSPAFTLIALFSLSLGIGANTAIFTAVNAILIRERPFTEPEELQNIYRDRVDGQYDPLNYPDYLEVTKYGPRVWKDLDTLHALFELMPKMAYCYNYSLRRFLYLPNMPGRYIVHEMHPQGVPRDDPLSVLIALSTAKHGNKTLSCQRDDVPSLEL